MGLVTFNIGMYTLTLTLCPFCTPLQVWAVACTQLTHLTMALCHVCTPWPVWAVACTQLNPLTLALCQVCTPWPVWAVACTQLTHHDFGTVPGLHTIASVSCCTHSSLTMTLVLCQVCPPWPVWVDACTQLTLQACTPWEVWAPACTRLTTITWQYVRYVCNGELMHAHILLMFVYLGTVPMLPMHLVNHLIDAHEWLRWVNIIQLLPSKGTILILH